MTANNTDVPDTSQNIPASAGQNQDHRLKEIRVRLRNLTPAQKLAATRKGMLDKYGNIEVTVPIDSKALTGIDGEYGILSHMGISVDPYVPFVSEYIDGVLAGKSVDEIYTETKEKHKVDQKKCDEEEIERRKKEAAYFEQENKQRKERQKEQEVAKIEREEEEEKAKIERQKEEIEKKNWIENHGSPELKIRYEKGYDVQRRYISERLAMELPGFVASKFDNKPEFGLKNRSDPSDTALSEQILLEGKGIRAIVRWGEWDPTEEEEENGEEGEKGEIVYVENWHGYEIYKRF